MKFLAFADLHGDLEILEDIKERIIKHNIELVICAGDFTLFGMEMEKMLEAINKLPAKVLLIHGNHEYVPDLLKVLPNYNNITYMQEQTYEYEGYSFLFYGSDGLAFHEPEFDEFIARTHKEKTFDVLVIHQPPYETNTDIHWSGEHVGGITFRNYIEKTQPSVVICGHIHECSYTQDIVGKSLILNVGPAGQIIEMGEEDDKKE